MWKLKRAMMLSVNKAAVVERGVSLLIAFKRPEEERKPFYKASSDS
jgi:hypothetical protein